MNIIFPLAGLGERFTSEMYLLPKPMINILGQPMAIWSIESLNIQPEDKIYIGYNKILDKFKLNDGDKVLVPSCTWMTSVAPIFQNKLTPIFVDISLEDYCINLDL